MPRSFNNIQINILTNVFYQMLLEAYDKKFNTNLIFQYNFYFLISKLIVWYNKHCSIHLETKIGFLISSAQLKIIFSGGEGGGRGYLEIPYLKLPVLEKIFALNPNQHNVCRRVISHSCIWKLTIYKIINVMKAKICIFLGKA